MAKSERLTTFASRVLVRAAEGRVSVLDRKFQHENEKNQGLDAAVQMTHAAFICSSELWVLAKLLQIRHTGVVDLGCGRGVVLRAMRSNHVLTPYIGIDARPMEQWVGRGQDDFFFLNDFAKKWPLRPGSVDCLVCCEVLEHLPRAASERTVRNICESLRPGGSAIVTTPADSMKLRKEEEFRKRGHVHFWNPMRLVAMVTAAGCTVAEHWNGRYLADRNYSGILERELETKFGRGAARLAKSLATRFHPRIAASLLYHTIDGYKPSHIQMVIRKEVSGG